ncbi:MAG TPA: hypothetical protein VG325_11115 [Solirubrobacteraceae bacterium]|jgi:hypothetical protein|nr:hypothetical protein [Solirubrobacteraceae bacterium]
MGCGRLISILSAAAALLAVGVVLSAGAGASTTLSVKVTISGLRTPQKMRLRIVRNGRTVYNERVQSRFCPGGCVTTNVSPRRSPLLNADLQRRGELDVVLGLYTGGAHCCFVDQVFSYDSAKGTYVRTEHDFLDAGAKVTQLDGRYVFQSADARLAEDALTDFADSGFPIQIWRYANRKFTDVTRSYPALVQPDAARWLHAFNRHISNGVGLIAAWAADEDLLGNSQLVSTTLASEARRHRLRSALGLPHNSETAFVADLEKLLRRLGYTK